MSLADQPNCKKSHHEKQRKQHRPLQKRHTRTKDSVGHCRPVGPNASFNAGKIKEGQNKYQQPWEPKKLEGEGAVERKKPKKMAMFGKNGSTLGMKVFFLHPCTKCVFRVFIFDPVRAPIWSLDWSS